MPLQQFMLDYFEDNNEIFNGIKMLNQKTQKDLFTTPRRDPDEITFYSWLSEMGFGLYFNQFCDELEYEQEINSKEPDWTITMKNQKILMEVLRLNLIPTEELRTYIKNIHEIRKLNKENGSVKYYLGLSPISMSSKYFYGAQDKLEKKVREYGDTVIKYKLPLIICPATIGDRPIDGLDAFDFLIGDNKKGFFYTDDNFGKHVTGVLLRTCFSEYLYFHNELADNKLNQSNFNFFSTICYNRK